MALSRQKVPAVRTEAGAENLSARGAYQLAAADGAAQVTIFATGTEVGVALAARDLLQAEGIGARVVSVPCWELFAAQPADYRKQVIGETAVRVAVEAAVQHGLGAVHRRGRGLRRHAGLRRQRPPSLYKHFGITAGRASPLRSQGDSSDATRHAAFAPPRSR
jgi:transketolase